MQVNNRKLKIAYSVIGFLFCLFAVVLQFGIAASRNVDPLWLVSIRYFSFFTVVGNCLIGFFFLSEFVNLKLNKPISFFRTSRFSLSVITYASIVMIGYHVLLQEVWNPQGIQYLTDRFLHLINPLSIILYWILFVDKVKLKFIDIFNVAFIPLIYFMYVLLLGFVFDRYPYPFFDVLELGYSKVLLTACILLIVLLVFAACFVALAKLINRFQSTTT